MIWIRSGLFNLFYFAWTAGLLVWMFFLLPLPRRFMQGAVSLWARGVHWALRRLVGLDHEVRGRENIPPGPAILACKHQSAWETTAFYLVFREPAYVLKKELLAIPLWGWYARKCRAVAVDRRGGAGALRRMIADSLAVLATGRPLVIFPEGTRMAPGARRPYQPGIAALYARATVPVVPVALNSGLFWGRRRFLKRPGTIAIEFLAPMPAGLERRAFMAELEARLETAALRLKAEAEAEAAPTAAAADAGGR